MNDKLRSGFAVLVGVGWLFNLVAPVFVSNYEPNLTVNAPLMLILGSLYATRRRDDDNAD